ncbi:hypothetical protein [Histidinibacterium aquaticum]|uniref:Pilus assembly protein n=1 Tax=Histidinibacterium aquaticum TaxID=2613962 RepID=A0A5J5GQ50_9RHOB|nr:hypothetical protein [Histidinibacterium aquaticum]KAA9010310.1 hypothetical protein F3S47_03430 [Histidinibacterium aquaticum]
MLNNLKRLLWREDGAVTVDWVVLTAAIVGLSVAAISTVRTAATDKSTGIGARLSSHQVGLD